MPGLNHTQQDIDDFVNITHASHEDAEHFLHQGTTLQGAIEDYYAAQTAAAASDLEDLPTESDATEAHVPPMSNPEQSTGPRTLDGRPVEDLPEGWARPQKKKAPQRSGGGIATLWNTGSSSRGGDDDDEQEFYAGGEKSGLAVQNPDQGGGGPNSVVDNILQQAARNGPSAPTPPRSSAFRGSGNTLGSDEVPSEAVPSGGSRAAQPGAQGGSTGWAGIGINYQDLARMIGGGGDTPEQEEDEEEVQIRHITFWRNGFSIEDGPLLSYDDPENKALLEAVQSGRAPPAVFGVRYDQPLQLEVARRLNEDYQPPPKKPVKPFGGSGNRLGNVTPDVASGSASPIPGALAASSSTVAAPAATAASKFEVDESKPTTSIQVRLGDGTRIVAKVNLSHTVGDLRAFVSAARPESRPFVLQTTFPSKELKDDSATVEEAGLKNAVVVQRFV